ncbi:MAG: DUF2157 domain-containing protein [Dehalococcoidia bacterium]|nr:DUF2157 domain-containing protein [Dehalococcoidia bacterium]
MTTPTPRQPLDEQSIALLQRETSVWVARGLVTQEQAAAILTGYEAAPAGPGHWLQGRLITALAVLGAVLVGLGVILFIGANWQTIPKFGKLAMVFVGLVATYGAGFWTTDRLRMPNVGTAVILLGALLFGAAVFLVAQAYHVRAGTPSLFLWWLLGVLPLAYALRSRAVLVLGVGTGLATLGVYAASWMHGGGGFVLPFFALAMVVGICLAALGSAKRRIVATEWAAQPLQWAGALVLLVALYMFTFRFLFSEALAREAALRWQFLLAFHLSAGVGLATLIAVWLSDVRAGRASSSGSLAFVGLAALVGGAYWALFTPLGSEVSYALVFNVAMAVAILGLVLVGYLDGKAAAVNLGIGLAVLDIVTRYFDLAWRLLDRSVAFIMGGLLLLALGFALERLRRRVLTTIVEREQPDGAAGAGR